MRPKYRLKRHTEETFYYQMSQEAGKNICVSLGTYLSDNNKDLFPIISY